MPRLSFSEHPASVGETYAVHFRHAFWFGRNMLAGAFALLIHAVFPFLFVRTGSTIVAVLHDAMVVNRVGFTVARAGKRPGTRHAA